MSQQKTVFYKTFKKKTELNNDSAPVYLAIQYFNRDSDAIFKLCGESIKNRPINSGDWIVEQPYGAPIHFDICDDYSFQCIFAPFDPIGGVTCGNQPTQNNMQNNDQPTKSQTPKEVMEEFDRKSDELKKEFKEKLRAALAKENKTSKEYGEAPTEYQGPFKREAKVWYTDPKTGIFFINESEADGKIKGYGFFGKGYGSFSGAARSGGVNLKATPIDEIMANYYRMASQLQLFPGTKFRMKEGGEEFKIGDQKPDFKLIVGEDVNVLIAGGVIVSKNGDWPVEIDGVNINDLNEKFRNLKPLIDALNRSGMPEEMIREIIKN